MVWGGNSGFGATCSPILITTYSVLDDNFSASFESEANNTFSTTALQLPGLILP